MQTSTARQPESSSFLGASSELAEQRNSASTSSTPATCLALSGTVTAPTMSTAEVAAGLGRSRQTDPFFGLSGVVLTNLVGRLRTSPEAGSAVAWWAVGQGMA